MLCLMSSHLLHLVFDRPRVAQATYRGALSTGDCHKAAHAIHKVAVDEQIRDWTAPESISMREARALRPCCKKQEPGSNSMTLLREPFLRAASAFFYRGHNPNNDGYDLR